ncbi:hypothetical protein V6N13_074236 [Hibiscus sabdariffa]
MMAGALLDILAIRRMDKLENVHTKRYSARKVIMPSGGLTVLSRYLRDSQGSCHDNCKNEANNSPGTDSKMRKIVVPKRGAGRNLVDRRKKRGGSAKVSPNFEIQEPDDHVTETQGHHVENVEKDSRVSVGTCNDVEPRKPSPEIKAMGVEGEAKEEEYGETKSPSQQVCAEPSPDSKSQRPVNPDCIQESVSPDQVCKGTDSVVAQAKGSKLKPRSKVSLSGKHNSKGPKRKEANIISGGRNKGEMTMSKGTRASVITNKKSVVLPSVSSSRKESDTRVSSMKLNAQKKNSRVVHHLKKHENEKQIKLEKSHAVTVNIPNKTPYPIESNSKKKPTESKVVPLRPSSSSKVKNMKHNQNQIQLSRPLQAFEKKKMIYRPKGIQTSGLPPSLSSFLRRNSSRGLKITRPSLTSLPSSTSLESFHNDTSTENDKALAETDKGSSKMMYKAKNNRASKTTLCNKHLPGKKLNFQRPKVMDVPVEDCTPRRLTFKKTESVGDRKGKLEDFTPRRLIFKKTESVGDRKGKLEDFTPRRLTFKKTESVGDRKGKLEDFTPRRLTFKKTESVGDRKGKLEDFTPRRLTFKKTESVGDRKGKLEDFTPRKLKFRQRVIVENRNGDKENGKVEEFTPRRLKFRRRVIVDNRNDDNQNGRIKELPPGTPEFRQKLIVDNMNAEQQHTRVDEFTLRKLELSQSELDNRNADDQNCRGEDSTPRELIFRPKVVDETKPGYVQSPKAFTSKNKSGGKNDNDSEIQSEKNSLRPRGVNEKKGSGILYNNIIEQTASRLAETKASRVKALVSAFETVISHLDTRISETNGRNRVTKGNLSFTVNI